MSAVPDFDPQMYVPGGKYKGRLWSEVPETYLRWLADQTGYSASAQAADELDRRVQDVAPQGDNSPAARVPGPDPARPWIRHMPVEWLSLIPKLGAHVLVDAPFLEQREIACEVTGVCDVLEEDVEPVVKVRPLKRPKDWPFLDDYMVSRVSFLLPIEPTICATSS